MRKRRNIQNTANQTPNADPGTLDGIDYSKLSIDDAIAL
jgi:hypothetical protein